MCVCVSAVQGYFIARSRVYIFSVDSVYVHLCMSIALMYCVDMATRVKQFLPPSVPMILVFLHMKL